MAIFQDTNADSNAADDKIERRKKKKRFTENILFTSAGKSER